MSDLNDTVEFQDSPEVPYDHRSTDEEGNPDDLYTEKEALALAKEQGIEFIDTYTVVKISNFSQEGDAYTTRKQAEKALAKLENQDEYTIAQNRRQK